MLQPSLLLHCLFCFLVRKLCQRIVTEIIIIITANFILGSLEKVFSRLVHVIHKFHYTNDFLVSTDVYCISMFPPILTVSADVRVIMLSVIHVIGHVLSVLRQVGFTLSFFQSFFSNTFDC